MNRRAALFIVEILNEGNDTALVAEVLLTLKPLTLVLKNNSYTRV